MLNTVRLFLGSSKKWYGSCKMFYWFCEICLSLCCKLYGHLKILFLGQVRFSPFSELQNRFMDKLFAIFVF